MNNISTEVIILNPELMIFNFTENNIRTFVDTTGKTWFAAKDVFKSLKIKWSGLRTSLAKVPKNWVTTLKLKTTKGEKDAIFLSEPAVYRVCFRSSKPEAENFSNWICETVIPSIRKKGYFGKPDYSQQIRLRNQKINIMKIMKSEKDDFTFQVLLADFIEICNQLGTPIPDLKCLGQDRFQNRLNGIQ